MRKTNMRARLEQIADTLQTLATLRQQDGRHRRRFSEDVIQVGFHFLEHSIDMTEEEYATRFPDKYRLIKTAMGR